MVISAIIGYDFCFIIMIISLVAVLIMVLTLANCATLAQQER